MINLDDEVLFNPADSGTGKAVIFYPDISIVSHSKDRKIGFFLRIVKNGFTFLSN